MTNRQIIHRSTPPSTHGAEARARTGRMWAARVLTGALALFLISSGAAKFGGGHVFPYIEHKSGIDLFDPLTSLAVGAAEVVAGMLILFRRTRLVGASIASFLMIGAVGFHLSPWLGVSVPTGLTEGAAAPWTADDFVATTTVVPFVLAITTGLGSLLVTRSTWRARTGLSAAATPAERVGRAVAA